MTEFSRICSLLGAALLTVSPALGQASGKSDILPSAKRQSGVALASRLSKVPVLTPLPRDLKTPFNPPGFEQADADEEKAKAAAAAVAPALPKGDREILEIIANKVNPSGTFIMGGEPMLLISKKKFKIGDHLIITFDNRDYEIEIASIERTSFSLRLNRAEVSRPIKPAPAKNP